MTMDVIDPPSHEEPGRVSSGPGGWTPGIDLSAGSGRRVKRICTGGAP